MSNREHMLGHPAANSHLAALPFDWVPPYPLGVPKRVYREAEALARKWLAKGEKKIPLDPFAQGFLKPSDVPGVLIAAGPDAIFASLARIEKAQGEAAADRSYHALLKRALDDDNSETVAAMVRGRQIVMERKHREYEARKADRMQQADALGRAHANQCRSLEQTKQEMAAYVANRQNQARESERNSALQYQQTLAGYTAEQQLMMREDRSVRDAFARANQKRVPDVGGLRDELERQWQEREGIVAKLEGRPPLDVEFKPGAIAAGALGGLSITNDSARSLVLTMQGREVARF